LNPQPAVLETAALPIELLACMSRKGLQKQARHGLFLLAFPMRCVLPVMTAELLQFELLRHGLLVLRRRVVPTFALGTLKRDDFSACACHVFYPESRIVLMEPSARVELATPSLPRTCSTPELRGLAAIFWSGRRGSNPRPTAWKAVTLPTELLPRFLAVSCWLLARRGPVQQEPFP
jgi:hypothetical protein